MDRQGGDVFLSKWDGIINSHWSGYEVDWVYIPFNDWGEGLGIEPVNNNPPQRQVGYESCGGRVPQSYNTYLPREETFYLTTNQKCVNEFLEIPGNVCGASDPLPDIKANGSDEAVLLTQGDNLTVGISLDPGSYSGDNADWWLLYLYYNPITSTWEPNPLTSFQSPLSDLPYTQLFSTTVFPSGQYIFFFGVDMIPNGTMDGSELYYDFVPVIVTP